MCAIRVTYCMSVYVQASFVLCRVFVRSQGGTSISENGLSSCAEVTVSTVRHIGIQHDGFYTPHIVHEIHGDKSVPRNTDKSKDQMRLETEVDNQVMTGPLSISSIQINEQVMQYKHFSCHFSYASITIYMLDILYCQQHSFIMILFVYFFLDVVVIILSGSFTFQPLNV